MAVLAPLAGASPHSLAEAASLAMRADSTKSEPVSALWPLWPFAVCSVMLLAGSAWTASIPLRKWTTEWCQHCLHASGFLSLVLSIVSTGILYSTDPNDNRRYLAYGAWFMFFIAFVGECRNAVLNPQQYFYVAVPAFLMAGHLSQYLASQRTDPPLLQSWDLRRHYEYVPVFFTLWVAFWYCVHPKANLDDRPREEPNEDTELREFPTSTGGGDNGNNPGALPSQEIGDGV
jgi:hypothetical protein